MSKVFISYLLFISWTLNFKLSIIINKHLYQLICNFLCLLHDILTLSDLLSLSVCLVKNCFFKIKTVYEVKKLFMSLDDTSIFLLNLAPRTTTSTSFSQHKHLSTAFGFTKVPHWCSFFNYGYGSTDIKDKKMKASGLQSVAYGSRGGGVQCRVFSYILAL